MDYFDHKVFEVPNENGNYITLSNWSDDQAGTQGLLLTILRTNRFCANVII